MKHSIYALFCVLTIALVSCQKENGSNNDDNGNNQSFHCDTAILCIRNTDAERPIVYSWGSRLLGDTLWPGDCAIFKAADIYKTYDSRGNEVSSSISTVFFYTNNDTYVYDLDKCYVEHEAAGGFVDLKANCNNNKFDPISGELDIDCGGFCGPCGPPDLPCSRQPDHLTWDILGIPEGSSPFTYADYGHDYVEAVFNFSQFDLYAEFQITELPKQNRRFNIGDYPHEVQIRYNPGFYYWYAQAGGFVYLIYNGDETWNLEFCDLEFYEHNTSSTAHASASLTFEP